MIKELFKEAGVLHGHYCPGLAIGVRAAAEAHRILGTDKAMKDKYCIAENTACYLDGIQWVFGTTMGTKSIEVRSTGETAFNFYDRANGKCTRLVLIADTSCCETRDEKAEYILTAPFEKVFEVTEVKFEAPALAVH